MVEPLAAVGVAASVIQLVDFTTKVVSRLDEFRSNVQEVPESFRQVYDQLPVLSATLERIQDVVRADSVANNLDAPFLRVVNNCREKILELDAILEKTLPAVKDRARTRCMKAILSLGQDDKVNKIAGTIQNYMQTLIFYRIAATSALKPQTDERLVKIRQWLSAPDPSMNYQKALKQRHAETGRWLLESSQYSGWKEEGRTSIWLHGIPGCGKTILSSTVIEDLLRFRDNDPGKVVAYFFFDFNDAQKQNPELMLRSIICQLSNRCVKIPESLDSLYYSCNKGGQQPSQGSLEETMKQMIQEFPQVYIVLDALDECSDRTELTDILETIAGWHLDNLHFLVTSRRERDIESSLETFINQQNMINLETTLMNEDIQKYIQHRLRNDKKLQKWQKDPGVKQEIEHTLTKGAHGMFRWAVCQLDMLGDCRTKAALRRSLATLPKTLDKTYERILCAISEADSRYAVTILQWVMFSFLPLSLDQVAEIAAIDVKNERIFDPDDVLEDPYDILSISPGLFTIVQDQTSCEPRLCLMLAHYSVKEYLLSDRIRESPAALYSMRDSACHDAITQGCLGYLLQFQEAEFQETDYLSSHCSKFKLRNYCATYWVRHAERGDDETEGYSKLAMKLLSKENLAYRNWLRFAEHASYYDDTIPRIRLSLGIVWDPWPSVPTPLYAVSHFDLSKIVRLLIDRGDDINEMSAYFGSALTVAVNYRQERIAKLLVEKGADVNSYHWLQLGTVWRVSTPLLSAVWQWKKGGLDERFVRLLVEHGAESTHGSAYEDEFPEDVKWILQGNSGIRKWPP